MGQVRDGPWVVAAEGRLEFERGWPPTEAYPACGVPSGCGQGSDQALLASLRHSPP